MYVLIIYFFFFSSRRRHTRFSRDWSSDVCSSDLNNGNLENFTFSNGITQQIAKGAIYKYPDSDTLFEVVGWNQSTIEMINVDLRSEERRVGKECRAWWWQED